MLNKFEKIYPDASLNGVEPSRNAHKFFKSILPNIDVFEGVFEESDFIGKKFDLVTANGVLEHVPDPVSFLKNIRLSVPEDGLVYIGVPNFENNPADLFTYDHLSRFTPQTAKVAFEIAGFEIVHEKVSEQRVPMWYLLKPVAPKEFLDITPDVSAASDLATKSLREVKAFFESYQKAAEAALSKNKKVALYGTGSFGLIGTQYTKMGFDLIDCMLDDNSSIWGTKKEGIVVLDPKTLRENSDVSEIVISANPCYIPLIEEKLNDLLSGSSIRVHLPDF
ncbi:MAG: class I SAM-dependent methyltransferase [Flavobacteriales bacterium]|nr:class I SAM-dependent methyltransferase [Flavobacteriales bacterium]